MKEQSSILTPKNDLSWCKKNKNRRTKITKTNRLETFSLPFKMKEKTKGGLVLAETTLNEATSCFTSVV